MKRVERRQQQKLTGRIWSKVKDKKIMLKVIAVGSVFLLCCFLIFNIFIWASDVSKLEEPTPQPTIIYDQNGDIASKITGSKIDGVSIGQIPEHLIHAVIATEDQKFYKHGGINMIGIVRALTQNMMSGEIVAGGSTITQQLAKNVFLTQERTYTRKLKELILTKKIERTYDKDEIMERYLNQIYFGEGAWGIQRASETYFGKDVSELTLGESAMLAGLIKAPSVLSPLKDMNKSVQRRDLVLALMEKEGYITQNDAKKAKEQPIVLEGKKMDDYKGKYPYYVDHIIEEAIEQYGLTENEVLSGGLHIYTELNPSIQNAVEQVYKDNEMFPEGQSDQLIQSGAIFINPSTGGITALIGGRGEHTFRGFNRATQLKRQPASTMKPLAAYTPALEQGYEIYDKLQDSPINIDGYQPMNYDKRFHGEVTMYEALVNSYNIPPVWLLNKMGVKYGINAVERFGIKLKEEDHNLGLALGGMSEGISPLSMAQAYSTFPNDGVMVEAHSIQKIEDADGEVIAKWHYNETSVTKPLVAQEITYMLKGVVEEGSAKNAQVEGWEVAGKTGTTELPFANSGGAKDHWFVGYTPEIVGAVWMGYDQTDENHYLMGTGGSTVTKIFKAVLAESMTEFNQKEFNLPLLAKQLKEQEKKEEEQRKKEKEIEKNEKEKEKKEKEKEKNEKEKEKKEKEKEKKEKDKEKKEKEKEKKEKDKEKKEKEKEKKEMDKEKKEKEKEKENKKQEKE
ncbi:membrane carboxypeptidase [Solibacillus silvestris StLB046]|uniref:Membrane carboxypeptidase n=1 Tax=Solibacillus silvestris (strain StLB046) TaxID=1002809 RepID=F2F114_SOLSS|nr:PBP1A family penicillin-binding protein [Solibacillus silvestris]BAK16809.1 membrane carboxypeptidase [Solibacillus silvestris StLB046]